MSAGISLLELPRLDNQSNITFTYYANHPSIVINQFFGLGNSALGLAGLCYIFFGKPKIFERKTSIKVLLNAFILVSMLLAIFEIGVESNYFAMHLFSDDFNSWTMIPRIFPSIYNYLTDLRFWILCMVVFERFLLRQHPTYIVYARPLGGLLLLPSLLVSLLMIGYVLASNGSEYYGEDVNFNEFFVFSPTPSYKLNQFQIVWDALMLIGFLMSIATILGHKFKLIGDCLALYDDDHYYYKMACILLLYVFFFAFDRLYQPLLPVLPDYDAVNESFGRHQSSTNNFYSLLLPLQLIYLNKRYPPHPEPTTVRPIPVDDLEMCPVQRDPLLEEWNRAYDEFMEQKLRLQQNLSTPV